MKLDVNKLIQFNSFIFGSKDLATRTIGGGHRPGYWDRFIRFTIHPALQLGIRRFMIHCPGGALPGKPFELDQLAICQDLKLNWLLDDFVSAWKAFISANPGVEVICYLGTVVDNPNFDPNQPKAWMDLAYRSVDLPMQCGMSLGFDAIVGQAHDSLSFQFATDLAKKTKIYVEGFPEAAHPWWAAFNVIAQIDNLHRAKSDGWGVPYEQIKGETVQLANMPPQGHTYDEHNWEIDYYAGLLSQGFSLCAFFDRLIPARKTLTDLAAALQPL